MAALEPVYFVPGRLAGGVPLTLDRQPAILHGDLHLAGCDAGNLDRHHVSVARSDMSIAGLQAVVAPCF